MSKGEHGERGEQRPARPSRARGASSAMKRERAINRDQGRGHLTIKAGVESSALRSDE